MSAQLDASRSFAAGAAGAKAPSAFEVSGSSPPAPMYLTAAQVAARLQVDEKTLYRWASTDPTLPVLRIRVKGARRDTIRFPRERLLKWLRDREHGRARAAS